MDRVVNGQVSQQAESGLTDLLATVTHRLYVSFPRSGEELAGLHSSQVIHARGPASREKRHDGGPKGPKLEPHLALELGLKKNAIVQPIDEWIPKLCGRLNLGLRGATSPD
jgi:hypothetical protein